MESQNFSFPPALKIVVGIGTFVIAGLMAREAAGEGLDLFEEKVNGQLNKINKKSNVPQSEDE